MKITMKEAMAAGGHRAVPESADADRSARLWYGAFRRTQTSRDTASEVVGGGRKPSAPAVGRQRDDIAVRVWLFGLLATVIWERPVVLNMATGFSATDVIDELARRYGAGCSDAIGRQLAEIGERGHIFVDGVPIADMHAPLDVTRPSAELEIILLVAYEGG